MEQEDDEPSEDEEFLRTAKKIIEDFGNGVEVSHRVHRLKRPAHSYDKDATGGIYEVLEPDEGIICPKLANKVVEQVKSFKHSVQKQINCHTLLKMIASLDKSTRSPSASPPPSSSPLKTNENPSFSLDQRNGSAKKRLCFSPAMQVGESGSNEMRWAPFVPKLDLDFTAPSSVNHSPQPGPLVPDEAEHRPILRTRCRQCHSRGSPLHAADFLYLIIFGFITSVIVYYLYLPPLHKGPVF